MKLNDVLMSKRKADPQGLRNAQRTGTMAEYLHDDLIAAGINPDSLVFGGNPDLAVGSSSTVGKNLNTGLTIIAKHETAAGTLTNKPVEKFLDAESATSSAPHCPSCSQPVYKAEEVLFQAVPYHKNCLRCGLTGNLGCHKVLPKAQYELHGGLPYCLGCFQLQFGVGAARGTVLNLNEKDGRVLNLAAATQKVQIEPIVPEKKSVAERAAMWQTKVTTNTAKGTAN